MVKHILGQAVFQSIVILTILFAGPSFIAEQFCDADSDYYGKVGGDYCGLSSTESISFAMAKEKLEKENPDYYASLVEDWNNGKFLLLQGMVQDTQ